MSRAVADFRSLVQEILGDLPGQRYTSTQIDNGLRWALDEYSQRRPLLNTYIIAGQGDAVITMPSDFIARSITRCQKWDADPDNYLDLVFKCTYQDESWLIYTPGFYFTTTDLLIITYTTTQTIDGLDSASGTSIQPHDEHLLAVGASAYVLRMYPREKYGK